MSVFDHFRLEERPLIEHFLDQIHQVEKYYQSRLTDFLDPREQQVLALLVGRNEMLRLRFFGGFPEAERRRALLRPVYDEAEENDLFQVSCFEVNYPQKFVSLTHPQLLGAIMGTGVDRRKIGDLLFSANRVQFLCTADIASYLQLSLDSVGRHKASLDRIEPKDLIHKQLNWQEKEGTVSSLRLDTVLSEIYHLSRTVVSERIERGLVKVNWQTVDKRDFQVAEGDMLSLRKSGRSKIISVTGPTKKNKIRLLYGKLNETSR